MVLHRRALAALSAPPNGVPDLARLAHHAEAAGDAEAVVRSHEAQRSARSTLGAHRESAAQYERTVRYAGGLPLEEQAEMLERLGYECYVTSRFDAALEAQQRRLRAPAAARRAARRGRVAAPALAAPALHRPHRRGDGGGRRGGRAARAARSRATSSRWPTPTSPTSRSRATTSTGRSSGARARSSSPVSSATPRRSSMP